MPPLFNASTRSSSQLAQNRMTIVNGRTFCISDQDGSIKEPGDGAIFEDVRILSRCVIAVGDGEGVFGRQMLAETLPTPFHSVIVSRPDPASTQRSSNEFYVQRQWVGNGLRQDLEVHNNGESVIDRTVDVSIDADFAHLFNVKAGVVPTWTSAVERSGDSIVFSHPHVADQQVVLTSNPELDGFDAPSRTVSWKVRCPPRSHVTVSFALEPHFDGAAAGLLFRPGGPMVETVERARLERWPREVPVVVSDDARVSTAVVSSLRDLASLRIFDPHHHDRVVVAAGAPWFMTLFGRDSLLTAWMMLPFTPELSVGVLHSLAGLQGRETRPQNEEQPGKILHELRRRGGREAFAERGQYYGTVDATPLFVMLAGEAVRWGHLRDGELTTLWPAIELATRWVLNEIEASPLGLVSYLRSTPGGLANQGWKDSWDGVNYADGRFPDGPVALSEVQGYSFAALRSAAELARVVGSSTLDPDHLDAAAEGLRERFEATMWHEASSSYAIGVAADGTLIDSVTTNPGHAVWAGICDDDRANRYLDRIMDDDLWSGWGLRTLSPTCAAYDPLSYHNGSVWPHDTALVAAGANRIGRRDVADRLVDAGFDVAWHHRGRPPELFAGVDRSIVGTPVDSPDSCSPQAWASAATLLNVRTALDLQPPSSPSGLPSVGRNADDPPRLAFDSITGLKLGNAEFDLRRTPTGVTVDPA